MSDANVGEGVLEITADTTPAEKAVAGFGQKVNKQGDDLVRFGQKGLLATGLIIGGLGLAGKAASDLNESVNAVNVTYGASAAGILALGEKAAQAVGLSSSAFNGLAVQFNAFATQIAGPGGNVVEVVDEMTTRMADFASVMNLDVPEAAQIFQSALAGETEPIRKFGIDLSAAAVEAYALKNGIIDAGEAMTEQDKVQARYGLLMQSTAKTAGDFAATSDGAANSQRILAAEMANMGAKIGATVLPPLTTLVGAVSDVVGWIGQLDDATGGAIGKFGMVAAAGIGLVSVLSVVSGHFLKLRDRVTTLNTDGSRSMSTFGKGVAAAAGIIGVATAVYGIYAADKERARQITDEFTTALQAEQAGQKDAIAALIARKVAESGAVELAERAGISATDLARRIRGEQVPALELLDEAYRGNVSTGERLAAQTDGVATALDLNQREVIFLEAKIGELSSAYKRAQTEGAISAAVTADLTAAQTGANAAFTTGGEILAGTLAPGLEAFGTAAFTNTELMAYYAEQKEVAAQREEEHAAAIDRAKESLEEYAREQEQARDAVIRHIESLNDLISTMRSAADASYAVQDASDSYAQFLEELDGKITDAKGDQADLNAIYREGTGRAADVADATARLYEETLKANGETLTATQRLDIWNQSMLTSASTASGPLRQSIVDYLVQVNQIPADKVTALEMYVNAGMMAEAEALIDETSRARGVAIEADVTDASLTAVETALGTLTRPRFVTINGQLNVPKFDTGTDFAPGGIAYVHRDELIELPRGSKVHTAAETRAMMNAASSTPAPGAAGAQIFPDTLILQVEGQLLTARVVAHDRDRAARITAGRRG